MPNSFIPGNDKLDCFKATFSLRLIRKTGQSLLTAGKKIPWILGVSPWTQTQSLLFPSSFGVQPSEKGKKLNQFPPHLPVYESLTLATAQLYSLKNPPSHNCGGAEMCVQFVSTCHGSFHFLFFYKHSVLFEICLFTPRECFLIIRSLAGIT